MSFTRARPAGWTDGVDTITAAQINQIDTNQSRAVDGTGGGSYTPTSTIDVAGTHGLRHSGTGDAAWPQIASTTQEIFQPFSIAVVIPNKGPGADTPSAVVAAGDVTTTIGGLTVASGCIESPSGAISANQASYAVLEFPLIPDGATIVTVKFVRKGYAAATNHATYTMVRWQPSSALEAISTVDVADSGTWTNAVEQTVTATVNNIVNRQSYRYGLLVKNGYDGGVGSGQRIYGLHVSVTATTIRLT